MNYETTVQQGFFKLYLDSERQMSNTSSDHIFTAGARFLSRFQLLNQDNWFAFDDLVWTVWFFILPWIVENFAINFGVVDTVERQNQTFEHTHVVRRITKLFL